MVALDKNNIPSHVAVIMDGNGRWAKQRNKQRIQGHEHAKNNVRDAVFYASKIGVKYLTLFAFSCENWNRPKYEVSALMTLLNQTLDAKTKELHQENVKLTFIGSEDNLPKNLIQKMSESQELTKNNTGLNLILALNYSGRWDILNAVKNIVAEQQKNLNIDDLEENMFSSFLSTKDIPEPELLIRTGGEQRISNFLLWQLVYTELYFTPTLWPDFSDEDFNLAISNYQKRERRFGMTSEQIAENL